MRAWFALAAVLLAGGALAQQTGPCPPAAEVTPQQLLGVWQADIAGSWDGAKLRLERHPVYAQSFRGTLERSDGSAVVAGDLEDGEFTLEESADGQHIAAAWLGEVVEGSCGREIRGTWTPDGHDAGRPFVLRKQ